MSLAELYRFGQGVERDGEKALYWLTLADSMGSTDAANTLGYLYATGEIVDFDLPRSLSYYENAGAGGNIDASFSAGMVLLEINKAKSTTNQKADLEKAANYFYLATKKGHAAAHFQYGFSRAIGRGIERSKAHSFVWLMISELGGNKEAKNLNKGLLQSYSAEQKSAGIKIAQECIDKAYENC